MFVLHAITDNYSGDASWFYFRASFLYFNVSDGDLTQYQQLKEGMLVGLYVEHHWPDVCPQIASITNADLDNETLTVQWYHSSWSGKCNPVYRGSGKNRVPVTEQIDVRCAVLWDFALTSKNKALKAVTIQRLKTAYRSIGLDAWFHFTMKVYVLVRMWIEFYCGSKHKYNYL